MGGAHLKFSFNKFLLLKDILYIHRFSRNLISVSKLHEQLFDISFANNSIVISKNGLDICHACLKNGPYFLRPTYQICLNAEIFKVANPKSNKKQKLNSDDETYLWHLRLGHIN